MQRQKTKSGFIIFSFLLLAALSSTSCGHHLLRRLLSRNNVGQTTPLTLSQTQTTSLFPTNGWPGSPVVGVRVLVNKYGGRVSWSPQGPIAYSLDDHIVSGTRYADIYTSSASGSNPRCLTCTSNQIAHLSNDIPLWAPNGNFIIFQSEDPSLGYVPPQLAQGGAGFDNNLWAATPDGKSFYQLTHISRGDAILHPQFSRNGQELAWAGYDRGAGTFTRQWDIHIARFQIDPSGRPYLSEEKVFRPGISDRSTFYETHGFTPNGELIFSSNMNSPYENSCKACALGIWEWYPASQQNPVLLTPNTSSWNEHASMTPDGKHIAWITSQGEPFTPASNWGLTLRTDWWLMNANGTGKKQITFFNSPSSQTSSSNLRVICADSSWNPSGTELVGTVDVIQGDSSVSKIVILTFANAE